MMTDIVLQKVETFKGVIYFFSLISFVLQVCFSPKIE